MNILKALDSIRLRQQKNTRLVAINRDWQLFGGIRLVFTYHYNRGFFVYNIDEDLRVIEAYEAKIQSLTNQYKQDFVIIDLNEYVEAVEKIHNGKDEVHLYNWLKKNHKYILSEYLVDVKNHVSAMTIK